jgi:hypothetical protein
MPIAFVRINAELGSEKALIKELGEYLEDLKKEIAAVETHLKELKG